MSTLTERQFIGKQTEPEIRQDDEPLPLPVVIVELTLDEWDKASAFELFGVLQ